MIELREINLQYVPTDEQVPDVVTKPLSRVKFPRCITGHVLMSSFLLFLLFLYSFD
jgi:hypothetical protein